PTGSTSSWPRDSRVSSLSISSVQAAVSSGRRSPAPDLDPPSGCVVEERPLYRRESRTRPARCGGSRGEVAAQLVETHALTVVLRLRLPISGDVLRHLKVLERFEIGHADHDGGELAVAGDADALSRIHRAAEDIGELTAQLSRRDFTVHGSHVSTVVHDALAYTVALPVDRPSGRPHCGSSVALGLATVRGLLSAVTSPGSLGDRK